MPETLWAVYPGSFDPVTFGHLDIIHRASQLFDGVLVTVMTNPSKQPLFSLEQRMAQLRMVTADLPNVCVDGFVGLTVDYARLKGARVLIRGLRAISDFELELQMAHTNKTLAAELETCFLATSNEYSFLSSSVVKQIARFGGPVDHLVPQAIAAELRGVFPQSPNPEKS
jgi:pantetheine-phosphate adenylyltransferase